MVRLGLRTLSDSWDNIYMGESLLPVADGLFTLPWIPEIDADVSEAIHLQKKANGELPGKYRLG